MRSEERALRLANLVDVERDGSDLHRKVLRAGAEEIRTAEHRAFLRGLEMAAKIAENLHKALEPLGTLEVAEINEETAAAVCQEVAENIRIKITTGPGHIG